MYALMTLPLTLGCKQFITKMACKWSLPSMDTMMGLQIEVIRERFFTHTTGKWLLPTMYTLMHHQMSFLSK
jgi:hypothetical protein